MEELEKEDAKVPKRKQDRGNRAGTVVRVRQTKKYNDKAQQRGKRYLLLEEQVSSGQNLSRAEAYELDYLRERNTKKLARADRKKKEQDERQLWLEDQVKSGTTLSEAETQEHAAPKNQPSPA